jgi:two-component system phosphate regulon response regulator PhoB
MTARVLVIDDEPDVARLVAFALHQTGFETAVAHSAAEGLLAIGRTAPMIVVLDVGLPDVSGVEVCRQLRSDRELGEIGIVMLTALSGRDDRIAGFEAGADDYVAKPFDVDEIVLRVRALARRISEHEEARNEPAGPGHRLMRCGALTMDPLTHEVRGGERLLSLRPFEFKLLATLLGEPGRVFRREELLRAVWGIEQGNARNVDTHLRRLRANLGEHAALIETVQGFGYRARP